MLCSRHTALCSALGSTLCSRLHALLSAPRSALGSTLCYRLHALLSAPCWSLSAVACCRQLPGCIAAVNCLAVLFCHYLFWVEPGSRVGEACRLFPLLLLFSSRLGRMSKRICTFLERSFFFCFKPEIAFVGLWVSLKINARVGNKHLYSGPPDTYFLFDLVYVTPLTPSPLRGPNTVQPIFFFLLNAIGFTHGDFWRVIWGSQWGECSCVSMYGEPALVWSSNVWKSSDQLDKEQWGRTFLPLLICIKTTYKS